MKWLLSLIILALTPVLATAQVWTAKLDKDVQFYQTTDLGVTYPILPQIALITPRARRL